MNGKHIELLGITNLWQEDRKLALHCRAKKLSVKLKTNQEI
jgi:hypothetical protein